MVMDGDWHEERPTLIDSSGWALNPECYYLNYLNMNYTRSGSNHHSWVVLQNGNTELGQSIPNILKVGD